MANPTNPLPTPKARALFSYIAGELGDPDSNTCDHTHRRARDWCEANGTNWTDVQGWLRSYGGYCDCEVLMNAAPRLDGEGAG